MKKMYGRNMPIQTEKEWDEVFVKQVEETARVLKIPLDEAERRMRGLLASGIMDTGTPDLPETRQRIGAFMEIPSEKYAELSIAEGNTGKGEDNFLEEMHEQEMYCLVAPDGTPQPMMLAEDFACCMATAKLLHKAGIAESIAKLMYKGFKIVPVKVTITQNGTAEEGFQRAKTKL
jgi:hypothetical protein